MSKNKLIMSALAMDLKRAALGYYRNSDRVADRFLQEAIERKKEINLKEVKSYVKKLLGELDKMMSKDNDTKAEDALMYSTLFQNAALQ
jgi:hypothetical protein